MYRHQAKRNAIYRVVEFTAVVGVIAWEKSFANFMNDLLFATNFPSLLLLYVCIDFASNNVHVCVCDLRCIV